MRMNEVAKMLGGSIAIYVIMAACGAGSGHPVSSAMAGDTQSGTRLKVRYNAGADGSKSALPLLHDSQLNVDCDFATAADGVLRCLPAGAFPSYLFVDAACSQPLAYTYKAACPPPYFVSPTTAPPCGTPLQERVYALGPAFTGTSAYTLSGQACVADSAAALTSFEASYALYTVGAEVPPSSFVQGTLQTDP
jgi:hypothetical protein